MELKKIFFDNLTKNFEVTFSINSQEHNLTLSDFNDSDQSEALALANKFLQWLESNIYLIKQFAANKLLELKNDSWLEEGETPITSKEFCDRISLDSVTGFSIGNFEVYFDDGEIFWGHYIRVDVEKDFRLERAEIAG